MHAFVFDWRIWNCQIMFHLRILRGSKSLCMYAYIHTHEWSLKPRDINIFHGFSRTRFQDLEIDCMNFIRTDYNRKFVMTLRNKNINRFLIAVFISEILKVRNLSKWKLQVKLYGSVSTSAVVKWPMPDTFSFMYLALRYYRGITHNRVINIINRQFQKYCRQLHSYDKNV